MLQLYFINEQYFNELLSQYVQNFQIFLCLTNKHVLRCTSRLKMAEFTKDSFENQMSPLGNFIMNNRCHLKFSKSNPNLKFPFQAGVWVQTPTFFKDAESEVQNFSQVEGGSILQRFSRMPKLKPKMFLRWGGVRLQLFSRMPNLKSKIFVRYTL